MHNDSIFRHPRNLFRTAVLAFVAFTAFFALFLFCYRPPVSEAVPVSLHQVRGEGGGYTALLSVGGPGLKRYDRFVVHFKSGDKPASARVTVLGPSAAASGAGATLYRVWLQPGPAIVAGRVLEGQWRRMRPSDRNLFGTLIR